MKKLLLLLCALLLTGCVQTYDGPTETRRVLLREERSYNLDGEHSNTQSWEYAYDDRGNVRTIKECQDGEPYYESRRAYDDKNRIISSSHHYYGFGFRDSYHRIEWTYDEAGRTASETTRSLLGFLQERSEYVYREDGWSECITYDGAGQEKNRTRARFDENGNIVERDSFGYQYYYTFDDAGNILTAEGWADGACVFVTRNEYDDQGRKTSSVTTGASPETQHWEYNDEQNLKIYYASDGSTRRTYRDANGDPLRKEKYDENGQLSCVYQYSYGDITVRKEEAP